MYHGYREFVLHEKPKEQTQPSKVFVYLECFGDLLIGINDVVVVE